MSESNTTAISTPVSTPQPPTTSSPNPPSSTPSTPASPPAPPPPPPPTSSTPTTPPVSTPSASPTVPSSNPPPTTQASTPTTDSIFTSVITQRPSTSNGVPVIVTVTSFKAVTASQSTNPSTASSTAAATSTDGSTVSPQDSSVSQSGLTDSGRIAIAVIVPIVAVALIVLAGIFFWRKRKQRKDAEELRRKEMEEYGYNPNNDPTLAAVAGASNNGDDASTVRDGSGYRGWGTTTSNRKQSNTMTSNVGMARSDSGGNGYHGQHSPTTTTAVNSDVNSGDHLMDQRTPNSETIGALGAAPVAGANRSGGVNRGPSNASSAYSNGQRSDYSDGPLPVGSPQHYNDYMYQDDGVPNGAHVDGSWGGQPVIREVQARRNTRIENPSVFPQQGNAGIAQNF